MEVLYRLETETEKFIGLGPYHPDFSHINERMADVHNSDKHPSIRDDIKLFYRKKTYYCGCPTLETLKKWFRGYLTMLKNNGFNIVKYTVSEYELGYSGKQCGFTKESIIKKEILK